MGIKKSYAVFGLGRYGVALAKELIRSGAEVIAVDSNPINVKNAAKDIPICKCADVADANVIEALGIADIDVVIVAMANNLESSVMTVALCKEAGVKNVIVKCKSEMHQKILSQVGADRVVFPEKESGIRLAKNLVSSGFIDMVEIADDVSIINIDVPHEWIGKTLIDLDLRKKYSVNVIAVKHGNVTSIDVNPNMPLTKDIQLVVIANQPKIEKLRKLLHK